MERIEGETEPQLAIIMDDMGYDIALARAVMSVHFPLALSVLPHLPFSVDVAEQAWRRGHEVLMHLPMESQSAATAENSELRSGMDSKTVESLVDAMLSTVPHAVGVSNHQGSLATADPDLMGVLMRSLSKRNLFFVDSRTTPRSVAVAQAKRVGVRVASRNVFLDNVREPRAIAAQLRLAGSAARKHGSAVAIAHPHPVTIATLTDCLGDLLWKGARLVFPSDVVG
jgi:hypothetical protein